jgi:hypothetical protein
MAHVASLGPLGVRCRRREPTAQRKPGEVALKSTVTA